MILFIINERGRIAGLQRGYRCPTVIVVSSLLELLFFDVRRLWWGGTRGGGGSEWLSGGVYCAAEKNEFRGRKTRRSNAEKTAPDEGVACFACFADVDAESSGGRARSLYFHYQLASDGARPTGAVAAAVAHYTRLLYNIIILYYYNVGTHTMCGIVV